ncbi:MAG TPA: hypothetical protein VFC67_16850 [Prolixibacteraceae bacterium]|nr:hypothetical protein [Prolixibacteraceae bacterium]
MNTTKKSHQQNVDNIEKLTKQVATFVPAYNCSEPRLSIANQLQLKLNGDEVLDGVMAAKSACDHAVSARTTVFEDLDVLVTRVANGIRISDVSDQTITQTESVVRDLRNKRAEEIIPPAETKDGKEEEEQSKHNKIRNGSFGTRVENFNRLLKLLLTIIAAYRPNEADLSIESLKTRYEALKNANSVCISRDADIDAARRKRQIVLYTPKTGLVPVALDSKLYVKSAYGANSPEYKSIRGLSFTTLK